MLLIKIMTFSSNGGWNAPEPGSFHSNVVLVQIKSSVAAYTYKNKSTVYSVEDG